MKNSDFNLDMIFTDTPTTTSSSTIPSSSSASDDISLFLRQLLHPSSQPFTSSSSTPTMNTHAADQPPSFGPSAVFTGSDRLVVDRISHDALNAVVFPPSSSESLSASLPFCNFDHIDFAEDNDYESEEGNEVAVEEMDTKQQHLSRSNHSKRARAAEVHNLSEKRRRSRINEKMKALQNLIPNSNKTDKASMLDEAIEYLKQLQLQVQMLSMRNGMSLHPMYLAGGQGHMHTSQLSRMGIDFYTVSGSLDINETNAPNTITESSNSILNFSSQCISSARPSLPITPTISNNSEAMSFGLESCVPTNIRPLHLRNAPQTVRREQGLLHKSFVSDNIETKSLVTSSTRPFSLGIGDSSVKRHNPIEELMQEKHSPEGSFLENKSGQKQLITSSLSGYKSYNWTQHHLS